MAAGITVYNNDNILQIDDSFGTLSISGKATVPPGTELDIPVDSSIAIKTDNGHWCSVQDGYSYISNNLQHVKLIGDANITYYTFSVIKGNIPPGSNFEVYDSNGVRIFSDTQQIMKVLTQYTGLYQGVRSTSREHAPAGWGRFRDGTVIQVTPAYPNKAIIVNTLCAGAQWKYINGFRTNQQMVFYFQTDNTLSAQLKTIFTAGPENTNDWDTVNDYSFTLLDTTLITI